MRISFNKTALLENPESLNSIIDSIGIKNITDKADFAQQFQEFILYPERINPSDYYEFRYHSKQGEKIIKIPIFKIQNFCFFKQSEGVLLPYPQAKAELDKITVWADNLFYIDFGLAIEHPISWENTINEMFGSAQILNAKELSNTVNRVFASIGNIDNWFISELEKINTTESVLRLIREVELSLTKTKTRIYEALEFYANKANDRLLLFDEILIKKHISFWEFVFNPERFNEYGFSIVHHPIYIEIIKPLIENLYDYDNIVLRKIKNTLKENDLLKLKSNLDNDFENFDLNQKTKVIDFIKLKYLPKEKTENRSNENFFKGNFKFMTEGVNRKIEFLNDWLLDKKECLKKEALPPQPIKTKTDIFKEKIHSMGFFNLSKVQKLTENGQNKLIGLITDNMAYGIAMFNYLGFCEFLDKENGGVKKTTNIALSKLYNEKAKDDSQARHYRNSLIRPKARYTSYLHKETVKNDYEKLI